MTRRPFPDTTNGGVRHPTRRWPVSGCDTEREKVGYDAQHGGGPAVEALKGGDRRQSEGKALAPGMKEMMDTMRLSYMPPPAFSEGSCRDYWKFRQAFKDRVEVTSISFRTKLNEIILSGYAVPIMATLQEVYELKTQIGI